MYGSLFIFLLWNNKNTKLKVEWVETKSDDIKNDNDDDTKWQHSKEFVVKNYNNPIIKIDLDNKTAKYLFQIAFFDGNNWSSKSNLKSISITKTNHDSWDPNCKGPNLKIENKSSYYTYK